MARRARCPRDAGGRPRESIRRQYSRSRDGLLQDALEREVEGCRGRPGGVAP